jgi:hypothetical protein
MILASPEFGVPKTDTEFGEPKVRRKILKVGKSLEQKLLCEHIGA